MNSAKKKNSAKTTKKKSNPKNTHELHKLYPLYSNIFLLDTGHPITVSSPTSASAQAYYKIAQEIFSRLKEIRSEIAAPKIVIQ